MVSQNDKELEEAYQRAKANLEVEGFSFTEKDGERIKEVVRGTKTREQILKEIKDEFFSS